MKLIIESIDVSLKILKTDKILLMLSGIPILIGLFLYGLTGGWIFNLIMNDGKQWVLEKISSGVLGSIAYYFLVTIVTLFLLIVINYSFVLIVSLIASPFNDMISDRVENYLVRNTSTSLNSTIKEMSKKILKTILTELKKLLLIFILSVGAFLLGLIPFFLPVSLVLSGILLSINFIDYNWSRDNLGVVRCMKNYQEMFLSLTISGLVLLFVLTIPIINLFSYPFAVVFFSVMYSKNKIRKMNSMGS